MMFCLNSKNIYETVSAWDITRTPEFCLFLLWICIGNLDAIFVTFTWSQFSRFVSEDYIQLVDFFGNMLWTSAVWSIAAGLLTDFISNRMKRSPLKAKLIVVLFLMTVDNFFGLTLHGLQYSQSEASSHAAVFVYNGFRALLYSSSAGEISSNNLNCYLNFQSLYGAIILYKYLEL